MAATPLPPSVFRALNPGPYLHAHLTSQPPSRPSSRSPSTFRTPSLNLSSLTHSAGSAVVRTGDTAVVAGVRLEMLSAVDASQQDDQLRELGLIVPNVEFATGCSGQYLPGGAPTGLAMATAWRVKECLVDMELVTAQDLEVRWKRPLKGQQGRGMDDDDGMLTGDETDDGGEEVVGYFTLYIDIVIISLAGNSFDAVWAAVVASLLNTRLPAATYDADLETIVCSPHASESSPLRVRGLPIASSFRVFDPSVEKGLRQEKQSWLLADPDEFEESLCSEHILVIVDCSDKSKGTRIRRLDKSGGCVLDKAKIKEAVSLAEKRWSEWNAVMVAAQ